MANVVTAPSMPPHPVAQVAERRCAGQSLGDRLFQVLVLHGKALPLVLD
jgi:hypothetical protein